MRIEDLRFFIRVAETGSINQVATTHYISPQGLSRIISNLETELDVKLFVRGKGLRLTPAGRILLSDAKQVDEAYQRFRDKASGMSSRWNNAKGNIYTIYATPVLCATILPEIITALNKKFPGVFFNVLERLPLTIADEISRMSNPNPRSMALLSIPDFLSEESETIGSGELRFEHLFSDELNIAVAPDSPLASQSKIMMEQLPELPFVVHNSEILMIKRLLGDGYRDTRITHTTNHTLCREMVAQGMTVGLTSTLIQNANPDDGVVGVPLEKKVRIRYGCVRWDAEDPFIAEIAAVIRDVFQKLSREID